MKCKLVTGALQVQPPHHYTQQEDTTKERQWATKTKIWTASTSYTACLLGSSIPVKTIPMKRKNVYAKRWHLAGGCKHIMSSFPWELMAAGWERPKSWAVAAFGHPEANHDFWAALLRMPNCTPVGNHWVSFSTEDDEERQQRPFSSPR